jgi:hypothetical protein
VEWHTHRLAPDDSPPVAARHAAEPERGSIGPGPLRAVLWVCLGVAATKLPQIVLVLWYLGAAAFDGRLIRIDSARTFQGLAQSVLDGFVLPVLLGIGASGGLKRRTWARVVLMVYAVAGVTIPLGLMVLRLWVIGRAFGSSVLWLRVIPDAFDTFARSAALPAILWILLRRPESGRLFAQEGRGFPVAGETEWESKRLQESDNR